MTGSAHGALAGLLAGAVPAACGIGFVAYYEEISPGALTTALIFWAAIVPLCAVVGAGIGFTFERFSWDAGISPRSEQPAHQPWRIRLWTVALAVWIVIAWPLATGPAIYAIYRNWWPAGLYKSVCRPVMLAPDNKAGRASGYWHYHYWWQELGLAHRARAVGRPPSMDEAP